MALFVGNQFPDNDVYSFMRSNNIDTISWRLSLVQKRIIPLCGMKDTGRNFYKTRATLEITFEGQSRNVQKLRRFPIKLMKSLSATSSRVDFTRDVRRGERSEPIANTGQIKFPGLKKFNSLSEGGLKNEENEKDNRYWLARAVIEMEEEEMRSSGWIRLCCRGGNTPPPDRPAEWVMIEETSPIRI